ncbi:hypothetical protein [Saccharopolyspora cebuensis]|uniref:hypothetical protein n=1 Tax=Saccharopolyspora cebuensis TaxID=418759 RepID=UPI00350F3A2B
MIKPTQMEPNKHFIENHERMDHEEISFNRSDNQHSTARINADLFPNPSRDADIALRCDHLRPLCMWVDYNGAVLSSVDRQPHTRHPAKTFDRNPIGHSPTPVH